MNYNVLRFPRATIYIMAKWYSKHSVTAVVVFIVPKLLSGEFKRNITDTKIFLEKVTVLLGFYLL